MSNKELLQNCIDECRNRAISFDDIKSLFSAEAVEQPKQWRSVPSVIAHLSDNKLTTLLEKANLFLENQKKYNNKLIVLYENLSAHKIKNIKTVFENLKITDTLEYGYSFDKQYIESINSDSLTIFTFKKIRSVFLKEDIDLDALTSDTRSEFLDFDHLVGVKAKKISCFDSLIIDEKNARIIIQIDLVSILRSSDVDKNLDLFTIMINNVISAQLNTSYVLDKKVEALNLYGCINNFYNKSEGTVTNLSFTTSKGVHHETLKGAATDIRTADYHLGGKAKEGTIYPYRITKKFKLNATNQPQAFLGVRYQYYAKPGGKSLSNARLFDVYNYQSYLLIVRKLIENI